MRLHFIVTERFPHIGTLLPRDCVAGERRRSGAVANVPEISTKAGYSTCFSTGMQMPGISNGKSRGLVPRGLPPALLVALAVCWTASGQTYTISTFAGGGLPNNIPGTSANLIPQSVAVDKAGNAFILDVNAILRLDATAGILTVAAGNGTAGFSGDNGVATNAQLNMVSQIVAPVFSTLEAAAGHRQRGPNAARSRRPLYARLRRAQDLFRVGILKKHHHPPRGTAALLQPQRDILDEMSLRIRFAH